MRADLAFGLFIRNRSYGRIPEKTHDNPSKTSIVIDGLALGGLLAACAQAATRESTGAYVDDASIITKVKAAILDDAALNLFAIHVDTVKDMVEQSGFVGSQMMIARAGHVAAGFAGVRSVRNDLAVR